MKITHPTTLTGIYSIYLCTIRNRGRGQPGPRTAWASACGHFSRMPTEINRLQCRAGVARPFLVSFYVGGHARAYVGYHRWLFLQCTPAREARLAGGAGGKCTKYSHRHIFLTKKNHPVFVTKNNLPAFVIFIYDELQFCVLNRNRASCITNQGNIYDL